MQIESASAIKPIPSDGNGHVQEVVRQAHEELRQLLQQRADVMRRIGTIKQTIAGLANLFGDDVLNDELLEMVDRKSSGRQPGFTKACRTTLMDANRALSARDVCDRIQAKFPLLLSRHKDPMASVTTVLNRLVAYGEARAVALDKGRRAWEWVAETSPAEPVSAEADSSEPSPELTPELAASAH
jgi:chorismate mutase